MLPSQSLMISYLFTVTGTDEVAVTSARWSSVLGWTGAVAALAEIETADAMGGYYNEFAELMSNGALNWATYSVLAGVKIAAVGTDDLYLAPPLVYTEIAPSDGTVENNPAQCTCVLSLRSGLTIGRANYGRMYLPHCRPGQATGQAVMTSGTTEAIAVAGKTWMNNTTDQLNSECTATLFPQIMSAVGSGVARPVAQIAVGNVTDTQRRRRAQIPETYSFEDLA